MQVCCTVVPCCRVQRSLQRGICLALDLHQQACAFTPAPWLLCALTCSLRRHNVAEVAAGSFHGQLDTVSATETHSQEGSRSLDSAAHTHGGRCNASVASTSVSLGRFAREMQHSWHTRHIVPFLSSLQRRSAQPHAAALEMGAPLALAELRSSSADSSRPPTRFRGPSSTGVSHTVFMRSALSSRDTTVICAAGAAEMTKMMKTLTWKQ